MTVTRVIPKMNGESTLTIDRAEWNPVERIVERLSGRVMIHDHRSAGAFHGRHFVPVPHYLLELEADPDQIDQIIEKIDPLVNEIIVRNIHTNTVPAQA